MSHQLASFGWLGLTAEFDWDQKGLADQQGKNYGGWGFEVNPPGKVPN